MKNFFGNMSKKSIVSYIVCKIGFILFIAFMIILLMSSCSEQVKFNKLEPPIRIIAKGTSKKTGSVSVIVIGAGNKVVELKSGYYFTLSIHQSYEIGDTVLFNPKQ